MIMTKFGALFGSNKIWICVSQKFEITKLLNEMVESVASRESNLKNSDAIIQILKKELKGKKVLVVFDDVWNANEDSWGSLKGYLHRIGTAPGSVILITTRSDEVAKAAGSVYKHKLQELSTDKSWSLLREIVSNNGIQPVNSCLVEIGKRIVEKCKGVPLAIKVMGGLLQSKHHLHEWESIEKSELWDLPHAHNQILPSLLLSFNHLPSSVKQCFAYHAMLPKGCTALKSELIGLWLSQGYLREDKRNKLTIEEIAEENLQILLNNSLLEEFVPKELEIVCYRMHDLVFNLALYVCGSDLITETEDLLEEGGCRHLLINFREKKSTSDFLSYKPLTKLRTLGLKGTVKSWNMLTHTRYLRTLLLDRTGITEIPAAIALLKHLRFLDVSCNPISSLPDSISKLYQLQTLVLQDCRKMKKLPKAVNKLVNLRHILTTVPMFACKGLRQLTNLQSFPALCLDNDGEGWSIDELGDLHDLRDEIHIQGLQCVKDKEQARQAGLAGKSKITKLTLSWLHEPENINRCVYDDGILEGLEPHPNITSLEVQNFVSFSFPEWVTKMAVLTEGQRRTQLNNLTDIKLLNCTRCKTVPTLGNLPLLKCLVLSGLNVECIGLDFYGSEEDLNKYGGVSFPSLVELEISGFEKLNTWIVPQQATFPRIETLRVRQCKQMKAIPAFGTKSLLSLELVNLIGVELLDIIKDGTGLTSLIINILPELTNLPQELGNCTRLHTLRISNCKKLMSLPIEVESLVSLRSLKVTYCRNLTCLPEDLLQGFSSLLNLEILGCSSLRMSPTDWEGCTSLELFTIMKCPMITASPTHISKLQHLKELRISCLSAEHLRSVLKAAICLPKLICLGIDGFRDEKEMREYFSDMTFFLRLPSLTELVLWGAGNIKTLPEQVGLLTRITHLYIWNFDELEEIPDWICNLSSLDCLVLEDCKSLKSVPSKEVLQHLPRLSYLKITGCPRLAERYAKDDGPQWQNISHISYIKIDGEEVQDLDK